MLRHISASTAPVRNMDEWYASLRREAGRQVVPAAGAAGKNLVRIARMVRLAWSWRCSVSPRCCQAAVNPRPRRLRRRRRSASKGSHFLLLESLRAPIFRIACYSPMHSPRAIPRRWFSSPLSWVRPGAVADGDCRGSVGDIQARFDDVGYLRRSPDARSLCSDVGALTRMC